jgi:hypothetical protein
MKPLKHLLLIAFLLFSVNGIKAQYLDNSMVWTEHYSWLLGATGSRGFMDYTLSVPDDTIISGVQYYQIERHGIQVDTNVSLSWPGLPLPMVVSVVSDGVGYLREDGESIYYLPNGSGSEFELYDFGIGIGGNIGSFEVTSIDTVLYNGEQRRRYWTTAPISGSYMIEGVGHTFGGLLHPGTYYFHDYYRLVCAGNSSMADPYVLDSTNQCDFLNDFTVSYQLPCAVPSDSVHVTSGVGSGFVFDGDTTASLFFSNSGSYVALVFDSLSGDMYNIAFDISLAEPEIHYLTASSDSLVCPGDTLEICGLAGHDSYLWSLGITTQCALFTNEWCGEGLYFLYSIDALGCWHEYHPFEVLCGDSVSADFEWDFSLQAIAFSNNSINATDFFWDFGDGSSSTDENPYNFYSDGVFEVCLIAQNECMSDTVCQTILIETGVNESDDSSEISIRVDDARLLIKSESAVIEQAQLFDSSGRQVVNASGSQHLLSLDMTELSRSIYVVRGTLGTGKVFSKTFIY